MLKISRLTVGYGQLSTGDYEVTKRVHYYSPFRVSSAVTSCSSWKSKMLSNRCFLSWWLTWTGLHEPLINRLMYTDKTLTALMSHSSTSHNAIPQGPSILAEPEQGGGKGVVTEWCIAPTGSTVGRSLNTATSSVRGWGENHTKSSMPLSTGMFHLDLHSRKYFKRTFTVRQRHVVIDI